VNIRANTQNSSRSSTGAAAAAAGEQEKFIRALFLHVAGA